MREPVNKQMQNSEESNKNDFWMWFRVIKPILGRYLLVLGTGLFAVIPGLCLVLLVTFAVSQLQGQPRLLTWPELIGEHASRWLLPVVRQGPLEDGLPVEYQRWFIPPALMLVGLLANLLRAAQEFWLESLGEIIAKNLRNETTELYLSSNFTKASMTQGALLANFYGDDSREIRQCFTRLCGSIPTELFNSVFYLTLLLLLDTQLFILFFAIFVPAGLIVRGTGGYLKKLARIGIRIQTELSQSFLEKMKGWQSIQSFRSRPFEAERFEETNSAIFNIWRRSARAKALSSPTVEWLGLTAGAFVLVLALRRVSEGALPSTILTAFLVGVAQLSNSLQTAINQFNSTKKGSAALKRLIDFLDLHSTSATAAKIQVLKATKACEFTLKAEDVALVRPDSNGQPLFAKTSFSLKPGDSLAIVGPSGSGKSTLLECISGLRPPDEGVITLTELEGRQTLNPKISDHLSVAYLTQDPFYFVGSVGENVCYPHEFHPSHSENHPAVKEALTQACLNNITLTDPVQNLSGGEKQRLAFARGFYSQPHIWIIDEGTSALDEGTEAQLLKNLNRFTQSAVKIFVAHRSSMQRYATQTIIVEK